MMIVSVLVLQCQTPSIATNTIQIPNFAKGLSPIPNDSTNRYVQLLLLGIRTVCVV